MNSHRFDGFYEWEIRVYETGGRFRKWNAKIRDLRRIEPSPPSRPHPPSPPTGFWHEYHYGDPFAARTADGALKKALHEVRRCDAIARRDARMYEVLA